MKQHHTRTQSMDPGFQDREVSDDRTESYKSLINSRHMRICVKLVFLLMIGSLSYAQSTTPNAGWKETFKSRWVKSTSRSRGTEAESQGNVLSFGWVWADKQKLRRKQNKKGRIRIVD
jgi:hypothetical protein